MNKAERNNKKAFETTKLADIWKALSNKGITQKIVKIIRATYEKTSDFTVLHNDNIINKITAIRINNTSMLHKHHALSSQYYGNKCRGRNRRR